MKSVGCYLYTNIKLLTLGTDDCVCLRMFKKNYEIYACVMYFDVFVIVITGFYNKKKKKKTRKKQNNLGKCSQEEAGSASKFTNMSRYKLL